MALTDYFTGSQQTAQTYTPATPITPTATTIQSNLSTFLDPNSEFQRQAKLSGLNTAAERGGVNSSIAAGAAQRASLDTASTLASAATQGDLQNQNAITNANIQNWAATQGFNRELFGSLYGQAYGNSLNMLSTLGTLALQDPETYTPEVMSGFTNFFQQMSGDFFSKYYG